MAQGGINRLDFDGARPDSLVDSGLWIIVQEDTSAFEDNGCILSPLYLPGGIAILGGGLKSLIVAINARVTTKPNCAVASSNLVIRFQSTPRSNYHF